MPRTFSPAWLRSRRATAIAATVVLAGAAVAGAAGSRPAAAPAAHSAVPYTLTADTSPPASAVPGQLVPRPGQPPRLACGTAAAGQMACQAVVDSSLGSPASRTAHAAGVNLTATPQPYLAADLQSAYSLPGTSAGASQTIAIVDAYDDPNAASDLAAYRAFNHLPACSGSCFRKVAQDGSGNYPTPDPAGGGWALEESLDLDMASAICPSCDLLLVEANDNGTDNLGQAVDEAVKLGATVVSNSYGGPEYGTEQDDASHWNHLGVVITASSGDGAFGVQVPAAFPSVVAVGGTTLYPDSSARGWAETAWSFAGSGCSAYIPKPSWQRDTDCAMKTVADVAAVADPDTPVWVYDTFETGLAVPWLPVGGTSASSPIIAAVYALAGNAATVNPGQYLADHHDQLNDVTSGSNGYCGGGYLCSAVPGYDGPTGLGTPHGTGAF